LDGTDLPGLLFIITDSLIMIVFNPWHPLLEVVPDYLGIFSEL